MARSNFSIGQNKAFNGQTSAQANFAPPSEGDSNEAAKRRIEMIKELRKSHLPSGDAKVPSSTA